jgi:valyl-tRNA synthetase
MLNMLDAQARIAQTQDGLIPAELIGLDRFVARGRVVEMLEPEGLLEKVEDRTIQTPYGDRSGVVIEPWLTDQWYVDAATLAKKPLEAVRSGDIKVVPKTWEKTWFNWLENIQPWCVSRQLWWGHQIPAWYGPVHHPQLGWQIVHDQSMASVPPPCFVGESFEDVQRQAAEYYKIETDQIVEVASSGAAVGDDLGDERPDFIISEKMADRSRVRLWRDQDVLDTWFSSALWPFATLGWPEQTETLRRHYPNDVLVSGFDIIFFWDARMAMQGFQFMGEKPWKTLYLHGLVRDAKGQKMSKSKGNTVDPLGLIDRYGADALRFTLAAMESQGRDIKLDEKRIEGYRNFATKLWNAARFCQANGIAGSDAIEPPAATTAVNRWIIGETVRTVQTLDLALADFRFDESANTIYQFVWATFCDWYLELIKGQIDDETRAVAAWVLDQILVMLHPFMPFITEELWHAMGERSYPLILAKWPMPFARALDPESAAEVEWLIGLITEIRRVRNDVNVPAAARTELWIEAPQEVSGLKLATVVPETTIRRLQKFGKAIYRLARCSVVQVLNTGQAFDLESGTSLDRTTHSADVNGAASLVVEGDSYLLPLKDVIDIPAERARLAKALQAAETERDVLAGRLDSASFLERAKPEAVEKARANLADRAAEAKKYRTALNRLS